MFFSLGVLFLVVSAIGLAGVVAVFRNLEAHPPRRRHAPRPTPNTRSRSVSARLRLLIVQTITMMARRRP